MCFGVLLRSQTWTSGRKQHQKSSFCEVLAAENPDICLHHGPKVTNVQKVSDAERRIFLNLHISDNTRHSLLTGKKRRSGLFSRHGVRRGIPTCPVELENTLALNSTRLKEELQKEILADHKSGLDTHYAAGWPGRKGYFPLPSVILQHVTLIKLKYLLNCLLS